MRRRQTLPREPTLNRRFMWEAQLQDRLRKFGQLLGQASAQSSSSSQEGQMEVPSLHASSKMVLVSVLPHRAGHSPLHPQLAHSLHSQTARSRKIHGPSVLLMEI